MIDHGVTGFLGDCDEELAHHAATLAYDEDLRQTMIAAAREKLVSELANPEVLAAAWVTLFESVTRSRRVA
jgi:glycosyltransferase involved in cell wall biosynthesis